MRGILALYGLSKKCETSVTCFFVAVVIPLFDNFNWLETIFLYFAFLLTLIDWNQFVVILLSKVIAYKSSYFYKDDFFMIHIL